MANKEKDKKEFELIRDLSDDDTTKVTSKNEFEFVKTLTPEDAGLQTTAEKILPTALTGATPERGERTLLGNLVERSGATARAAIQADPSLISLGPFAGLAGMAGGNPIVYALGGVSQQERERVAAATRQGAAFPEEVPRFQNMFLQAALQGSQSQSTAANFIKGLVPSALGLTADIITSPAEMLLLLAGKAPVGGGKTVAGTKPSQAVGRFLTRKRSFVTGEGLPGGQLRRALNTKLSSRAAQNLRKEFFTLKRGAVNKFGSQIDDLSRQNPSKTVDLSDKVLDIATDPEFPVKTKSALRASPTLQKLLKNPGKASSVKLREVQQIINDLNTKVPARVRATDRELLSVIDDLKASQLDAFPNNTVTSTGENLGQIKSAYAQFIEPFNNVKSQFKFNRLLKNIETGFAGDEGLNAVRELFPPDILKDIGGISAARNQLRVSGRLVRRILELILTGAAAGTAFKFLGGFGDGGGGGDGQP